MGIRQDNTGIDSSEPKQKYQFEEKGQILVCNGAVYSKCHQMPLAEAKVYLVTGENEAHQFGITWFCPHTNNFKDKNDCLRIQPRYEDGRSIKLFANKPDDINAEVWTQFKRDARWDTWYEFGPGFFMIRDDRGKLCVARNPRMPKQEPVIPDKSYNAYQPESVTQD